MFLQHKVLIWGKRYFFLSFLLYLFFPPFFHLTWSLKCRIQNGKSKIKSEAASLQVRGEEVTVFIVILFHMATSSTFHSCYSFQLFLSGAAALLTLCFLIQEVLQARPYWKRLLIQGGFWQTTFVISEPVTSGSSVISLWEASGFLIWIDTI